MIIGIIIGGLLFAIGLIIWLFRGAIVLLAGYEAGKYDDARLHKFAGRHLMLLGALFGGKMALIEVFPEHLGPILWMGLLVFCAIAAKMVYQTNKNFKIKGENENG